MSKWDNVKKGRGRAGELCLFEMGIPVPEGIGICCSDMVKYSEIVHPAVACADIKQDMMGREAARTVIDLLEGRGRPRKLLISVDRIFTRDTM